MDATDIAAAVRDGAVSARSVAEAALDRLAAAEPDLCATTRLLRERALAEAAAVDTMVAAGRDPGPLAGVPYAVKDLFDVAGLATTAGAAMLAEAPPAVADAEAIRRLHAAGAVLVATTNMDAFAYGFATINAHHGTTRNPHDPARLAGGSSGGSAAVVAAGLVPVALGSDTNGSIRVPASLTGVYGLKPTHASLPMAGVYPFADSFDDIGAFTATARDAASVWRVLADHDAANSEPAIRLARLGGRFAENVDADQLAAMDAIAPGAAVVTLPDIARARSAAFIITAYEGGRFHRPALARDALAYDAAVRDRLIAGALLPDGLYAEAQAFRAAFRDRVLAAMEEVDILLAPATPCTAPAIDDPHVVIDGKRSPARGDLGIHTQPISFIGLPSFAVPIARADRLPLGLQLIGRPGGEPALFALAARLEAAGIIGGSAPMPAQARVAQGEWV